MGKDTTKASDHKSTNALDDVEPNQNAGLSVDAYLSFGSSPRAVVKPPHMDEIVEYRVKVECTGARKKRMKDGELRYVRDLEIISIARAGEEFPPDANEQQPAMIDTDGKIEGDPESIGDVIKGAFGDGVKVDGGEPDEADESADGEDAAGE